MGPEMLPSTSRSPKVDNNLCFRHFFVVFDCYTSETRLYRQNLHFSGKSNPSRLKTSISPTRTPNLIKIAGTGISELSSKHGVFPTFRGGARQQEKIGPKIPKFPHIGAYISTKYHPPTRIFFCGPSH